MSSHASKEENERRDKLIFELVREALDLEWGRINDLDHKAGNLIGFVGIIVSFVLGVGSLSLVQMPKPDALLISIFLFGVLILMGSMVLGLLAYRVRMWEVVPRPKILIEEYASKTHEEVLTTVGAETSEVVEDIASRNDRKADLIDAAWWFLVVRLSISTHFWVQALLRIFSSRKAETGLK